ncbi:MAG: helix-turn-helix domain-containing protein [Panacagrimonas sp.]
MKVRSSNESAHDNERFLPESATSIGDRLRAAREAMGLTQPALAAAAGIPLSTQQKYEGDHRQPGADSLAGYVRAGISAHWLLVGKPPMLLKDLYAIPPGALDAEQLKTVIVAIEEALEEFLSEQHLHLAPDKKADLILALYELTRDSGTKPQRSTILRLVRSAA